MKNLPFPEHVFDDSMSPLLKEFVRINWDSDPEKFLDNMEKMLNIKTNVQFDENGEPIMTVTKQE